MSLMTLAEGLALNVGLPLPDLTGGDTRDWQEIVQFANEAGEEISRRVQWSGLASSVDLPGSGALPSDYDRLTDGISVLASGGPVQELTPGEWAGLPAATGTPRYFIIRGAQIDVWPEGPVTVKYQSRNWAGTATGTANAMTGRDDEPFFDEDLMLRGLIVRWRRQKGMPYADEEAEFEAALAVAPQRVHGIGQSQGTDYVAIYRGAAA